ncbi:MAG: aspartate/glutamate racemase family protein [Tepidisphaeraceae bacterium]
MPSASASPAQPILVIDCALGGLSIVKQLRDLLPGEPIAYFADLARAPYSHRSPELVTRFVQQIVHYLRGLVPKHVLITCDIASAVALAGARQQVHGASVTGLLDPAARAAAEVTTTVDRPTIGVLASNAVIESRALERAVIRRRMRSKLICRPAPLLSAIVEDGRAGNDPVLLAAAEQYLDQLLPKGVDVILLASSSLVPIRRQIAALAGDDVQVVDVAKACADDVARRLKRSRLLHPSAAPGEDFTWFLTDESPAIFDRAERLAGFLLPPPRIVSIEELERAFDPTRLRVTG